MMREPSTLKDCPSNFRPNDKPGLEHGHAHMVKRIWNLDRDGGPLRCLEYHCAISKRRANFDLVWVDGWGDVA